MTKANKAPLPQPAQPIADFERVMLAHTTQQGVLDAVSVGIWGIAEQSGQLAGEWKRHRNYMQDLDTDKVILALGELLEAVTHTAHAVGVSLEAVMDQQIERVRTPALLSARTRKIPRAGVPTSPPPPAATPPANISTLVPSAPPRREDHPKVPKKQRQDRLPAAPVAVEQPTLLVPERPPAPVAPPVERPKRGRPRLAQAPAAVDPAPVAQIPAVVAPSPVAPAPRRRQPSAPPVMVEPMVPPEPPTVATPAKQPAAISSKKRRAGAS